METLKFLMTTDTYPPYSIGGDANHVFLLSNELANKGHEVHVVSNFDAYSLLAKRFNWKTNKSENSTVSNHILRSPRGDLESYMTYFFGKSKFYSDEYKKVLDNVRPDIVHHHDVTFLGHNFFERNGNYDQFHTTHNYWLICPNRESFRFGKSCEEPFLCSLCLLHSKRVPQIWRWNNSAEKITKDIDVIIAPSKYIKNRLSNKINNKEIIHLPNFIPRYKDNIESSGYTKYFLYVGQFEERKGIMNILDTFKRHKDNIDANLIIIGSGSIESKIRDFIIKHGMGQKILVLGRVEKEILWSMYNDAVALIVPSIWPENNPLVAIEALSVGTPVIGTNAGGIGEIIEKIDNGLIFKDDGFEAMKLILDKNYPKGDIKQIYDRWYSPEIYMKEYMKLVKR